ncbi:MAG: hypothetical protein PVG03_09460, partial [Desulfarculaceae bacterium]
MSSLLSLTMRMDILLAFGAYPGLVYIRDGDHSHRQLVKLLAALAIVFASMLALRVLVLGYAINPVGGTLASHFGERLSFEQLIRTLIRNGLTWAVSLPIGMAILAGAGLFLYRKRPRVIRFCLLWGLPYLVFLPFKGMDISRLIAPMAPAAVIAGVYWLRHLAKKRQLAFILAGLIAAQLCSVGFYYILIGVHQFKIKYDGFVLGPAPMHFVLVDHYYRQRYFKAQQELARQVAMTRKGNVLV